MPVKYPRLPFATDALEPRISKKTLELHYGKHHKAYVDAANKLIMGTPYESYDSEEIMLRSYERDKDIYNNAAQAWNHSFFWDCLSPKSRPSVKLAASLQKDFGTMLDFQDKFTREATKFFGAGWAWLVRDDNGNLLIRTLSNADNPMNHGEVPILVCDLWEHAYYLDYQNERSEYLKNFWSVVNWQFVEANLAHELPGFARARRPYNDLTTAKEFGKARATHR